MPSDLETAYLDATTMADLFRTGALSPVEAHDAIQRVIDAREPYLNALSERSPDRSRQEARASERRWRRGEPLSDLDGVPVTLKENFARVGVPISYGNAGVTPRVPDTPSTVADRVDAGGLVVLGSTVMPDWGMLSSGLSSRHGVTRSPLDLAWTTGGSSSGAGAAAAGGYGPLHVGSDIGGSIRLPGTWLGLTALKPSAGRIALDAPYLGRVAGPITRTARDAATFMRVLSGFDRRDYTALPDSEIRWEEVTRSATAWHPGGARIALHLDAGCGRPTGPGVLAAVEACASLLEKAGAEVVPIEPFMDQELLDALDLFWRVRSWVDYRALDQDARRRVLPYIANWCTAGSDTSGAEVLRAYQSIMEIRRRTTLATEEFDLVLSPVAPVTAFPAEQPMPFEGDEATMHHIGFTAPYNMSGQPAISVNCGRTEDGKTIGVQISGRRWDDLDVLRAAAWYEARRPAEAQPVWPRDQVVPSHWVSWPGA